MPITGQNVYPYPFGFNPLEASNEDDYQLNVGLKGDLMGWKWDVSTGYGSDKVDHLHDPYLQHRVRPDNGVADAGRITTTASCRPPSGRRRSISIVTSMLDCRHR